MEKLPAEAVAVIRLVGALWLISQSMSSKPTEITPEAALETVDEVLEKVGLI